MAGIYYHIPFCKRICSYCDFYRTALLNELPAVVEKMCREIEERRDYLQGEALSTRYFGGGTPSLLPLELVEKLTTTTERTLDCTHLTESTFEANPDDLTEEYLRGLRGLGIDRLSIGIQSFDDACLKLMNRRHTAEEAKEAVRKAQKAGFDNLTIDLIFGVPGFGRESLNRSIDEALRLGVQHISAYLLSIEPRTRFGVMAERGELQEVCDEVAEEEFLLIHNRLTEAGMVHYEVSNYALPGRQAQHNSSYWTGAKYLGIGPAAHSFDGRSRQWNVSSVERYLRNEAPEKELLGDEERREEFLLTRLRTAEGFSLDEAASLGGEAWAERLREKARNLEQTSLLAYSENRLRIPPEKMLLSDRVIGEFFDL